MKYLIRSVSYLFLTLALFHTNTTAQNYIDALRFSNFDFRGTARSLGVNGSMSALGADFSAASVNPAGIAAFRGSAFTITPTFLSNRVESMLEGIGNGPTETIQDVFELTNLGVVFSNQPIGSDWKTANFGIYLQQVGNFDSQFFYEGRSTGSIVDRFQELANSDFGLDDFESGLAFDAGAIYDFDGDDFFESDVETAPDAQLLRRQEVITEGAMNELQISVGGNLDEKLYVGLAIGIPNLTFVENRVYEEEDENDEVDFYEALRFGERFDIQGNGINVKAGVIVKVNQMFRVGVAVHTPTAWNLDDTYTTGFNYQFTQDGQFNEIEALSPENTFSYTLITPWRFIGSFGAIIEKSGFVTAEVEFVNYGSAKFRFDGFEEDEEFVNDDIDFFLQNAVNVRLGGEYVANNFRFRAGTGVQTSGFDGDSEVGYSFGGGVGFRGKTFFVALGYNLVNQMENFVPYFVVNRPEQNVENVRQQHRLSISGGIRFN